MGAYMTKMPFKLCYEYRCSPMLALAEHLKHLGSQPLHFNARRNQTKTGPQRWVEILLEDVGLGIFVEFLCRPRLYFQLYLGEGSAAGEG